MIIPDILSKQKSVPLMGMSGIDRHHFRRERITRSRLALTCLFRPETEWNLGQTVRVSQRTAKSGWSESSDIRLDWFRNHIIDGRHPQSSGVVGNNSVKSRAFAFSRRVDVPRRSSHIFFNESAIQRWTSPSQLLTICRPGWISLAQILNIACMTSTHWPHQLFELLSNLAQPNNA